MTKNVVRSRLREYRVLVLTECLESRRVLAANVDEARQNYQYGELEKSVELVAEIQGVEEAA
jgi:hypothetical protein